MQTIWIIGAGKFGRLAAKRLQHRYKILMVDPNVQDLSRDCESPHDTHQITRIREDGIQFLDHYLKPGSDVAWIIPCVPVHLAWEWCRLKFESAAPGSDRLVPHKLPKAWYAYLPNPMQGKSTDVYVSHATFLCPDNCSEPDTFCTKTKRPRKQDMHALLEALTVYKIPSLVIKSRQIAPGVGGYPPQALFALLNQMKEQKGMFLVSTACRCHGVITAVKRCIR